MIQRCKLRKKTQTRAGRENTFIYQNLLLSSIFNLMLVTETIKYTIFGIRKQYSTKNTLETKLHHSTQPFKSYVVETMNMFNYKLCEDFFGQSVK